MNQQQKTHWLAVMAEHKAADRLVQGTWLQSEPDSANLFRGCFYGCAMQQRDNPLEAAAEAMGLPLWLVRLSERIFEGLPQAEAVEWPLQFLEALPVNADLGHIHHKVAASRMRRLLELHKSETRFGLLDALNFTLAYHENPTGSARSAARSAAWSAAESAAWSARSAAWSARSAAESEWSESAAAESAESAAWSAAESAAWSAAESAESARSAAWQSERDALLSALHGE